MKKKRIKTLLVTLTLIFVLLFQDAVAFAADDTQNTASGNVAVVSEVSESDAAGTDGSQSENLIGDKTSETEESASNDSSSDTDTVITDGDNGSSPEDDSKTDTSADSTSDGSAEDSSKEDISDETVITDDETATDDKISEDKAVTDNDKNDTEARLNAEEANAAQAKAPELTAVVADNAQKVTITLKNVPDTTKTYKFAIWSDENGQDDLNWITAKLSGTTAKATVSLSKFKHTGDFNVHCYGYDANAKGTYVAGFTFNWAVPAPELTAEVADNAQEVTITLKNAYYSENTYKFAIWSEKNGQDDLNWITAELSGTTAKATVSLSKFKNVGDYSVHCYMYDANASGTYVAGTAFNLAAPTVKCSLSDLQDGGSFTFHMDSISVPAGTQKVRVGIWSKSDKSDRKWYTWTGEDIKCRLYSFNNNFGTYKVYVYVYDNNGMKTLAGSCKKTYSNTMTFAYSVKMAFADTSSSKFTVTIKGLNASNGIKALKAAVWSKDDQSNLHWYDSYEDKGNGTYVFNCDLANHGYSTGTYKIHIYLTDKNGNEAFLIGNTKKISRSCKEIDVSYSDSTMKAIFALNGLKSYGLYKTVKYAIWSRSDQQDLKWVSSTTGGTFKKTVDMSTFGSNGTYNVHCYGYKDDGTAVYLAGATFEVYGINVAASYKLIKVSDEKVLIRVYNANVGGKVPETVKVGVWSAATGVGNGGEQDDLVWYTAKLNSSGTYYYTTIDRNKHLSSGKYYIHVYAYRGNESAFCCGATYNLYRVQSFAGIYQEVAVKSVLACETGGQVYGNCTYGKIVEAYKNSSGETGISIGCACWMGSRAVQLLMDIRSRDPATFAALDTAGISADLDKLANNTSLWNYYGGRSDVGGVIKSGSAKANCISNLLTSDAGIAVQNEKVASQLAAYADSAKAYGVKDIEAQILMAETAWLGGTGAMSRIIKKASSLGYDMTVEDLWTVMQMDQADTSSANQVGDTIYATRHKKIIQWMYQYLD